MPQIVKGGKYIFGWTKLEDNRKLKIPPEALNEYRLKKNEDVLIISGSKASGGFGLTSLNLLKGTPIGKVLISKLQLRGELKSKDITISIGNRTYYWSKINEDGYLILEKDFLKYYDIENIGKLLVGRGSGLAIGFIARGRIFQEALNHPELEIFS